jgi:hypothetical protein
MPPAKKPAAAKAAAPVVVSVPPTPAKSEVKGSGTAAKPKPAVREITHDMIAKRAFEIYAGRGYAAGDQNADWLEAERQLKAGL